MESQLSYLQYLQQSSKEREEEDLQYEVQARKSDWEVSIAKTKKELGQAKRNLKQAYAYADLQSIMSNTNNVNSLEAGLKLAQEAFAVLFPAE